MRHITDDNQLYAKLLYGGILCLLLATILLIAVPPISRDALIHHLAIPKLYLQHGGIFEIPNLEFSYYPMNLDLLYMVPLSFGNDIIPKFIHFIFALGTAWLIYDFLKRNLTKTYGLLGSFFFLSIPVILKLSITVYVDLGLIFFSTASLLLLFRWSEEKFQPRYLIFAGISCGLAMSTKYNGLITFLILSAFVPLLYQRVSATTNNFVALRWGIIFFAVALLTFSPWMIRNFMWTGNPLYPLFENFFHPGAHSARPILGIFKIRQFMYHETPLQILLLPLRIFFEGRDNVPQFFDGKLNPFLLVLPVFAFISSKNSPVNRQKIFLALFCFLFFFIATFETSMRIRYIAPIIPSLVILAIFGLHNLHSLFQNKKIGTSLVGVLTIAMLAYNGNYLIDQFKIVQPLSYISGKICRDEYITRFRPEYPVIQFANQSADDKEQTLCLFMGHRGYYMDFHHTFDTPGQPKSYFSSIVSKSNSPNAIRATLSGAGYTKILLYNKVTEKWLQNMQQHKKTTILFFQHELELMYTAGGYTLFHIKDDH